MLRSILGAVAGYAAMFLVVFLTFSGAYLAMGANRAFQPGSYEVSALWIGVSFVLSLIAALVGGVVAVSIGRGMRAASILVGVALILGLLLAGAQLTATPVPTVRAGDVANLDAMNQARQPHWVALVNPLVGASGALLGARWARRQPAEVRPGSA
jgi:hypothetical protein